MKLWKPWFIENSRVPVWLSKLSPIDIGAITLGPFVFSRNKMSEATKRHEIIHFQQYLELAFVGFVILYLGYWIVNRLRGQTGAEAYFNIPFEREAYDNQDHPYYVINRRRYCWWKYNPKET